MQIWAPHCKNSDQVEGAQWKVSKAGQGLQHSSCNELGLLRLEKTKPKAAPQCLKRVDPLDEAIAHAGKTRSTLKLGRFHSDIIKNLYCEGCQALEQITQIAPSMSLEVFKTCLDQPDLIGAGSWATDPTNLPTSIILWELEQHRRKAEKVSSH